MLSESLQQVLVQALETSAGDRVRIDAVRPVSGGDINQAFRLQTNAGPYFVKTNHAQRFPGMFEAEAKGLALLAQAGALTIPEVITWGEVGEESYLLLEWLEPGARTPEFWEHFGRELAALHRHTQAEFGLDHANYIGSLPQSNTPHGSWAEFFVVERLEPQARLARDAGLLDRPRLRELDSLYSQMENLFPVEPPALLHGDLWSGNFLVGPDGAAALIDPATYFGHREMDLGMTRLFGGFDAAFYTAYHDAWPLESGYEERVDLANLYPLLVHVNLFGGSYLSQVRPILHRFSRLG